MGEQRTSRQARRMDCRRKEALEGVKDGVPHQRWPTANTSRPTRNLWRYRSSLIEYKGPSPKADQRDPISGARRRFQIWGLHQGRPATGAPAADKGLGRPSGITARVPPAKTPPSWPTRPFGEWNSFRIIQLGARNHPSISNNKLVVDHATMGELPRTASRPSTPKVRFSSRPTGEKISWKNVFLREIPADEANTMLEAKNAEGFPDHLRRQVDPRNWGGNLSTTMRSSMEICAGKAGKGGTIYYNKEIDRLRRPCSSSRLPPGGPTTGLAIRYPGQGRPPAYAGMTRDPGPRRQPRRSIPSSNPRPGQRLRLLGWPASKQGYLPAGRRMELRGSGPVKGIKDPRSS